MPHAVTTEGCLQSAAPSYGTLEMGASYLDMLDGMAATETNSAPDRDPQLELDSFIAANLSGASALTC